VVRMRWRYKVLIAIGIVAIAAAALGYRHLTKIVRNHTWVCLSPDSVEWPNARTSELWERSPFVFRGSIQAASAETTVVKSLVIPCTARADAVLILHKPTSSKDEARWPMMVQLGFLTTAPLGNVVPAPGTLYVQSWLTAEQAEHVERLGVPDSLQAALCQAADEHDWSFGFGAATVARVSPDKHFE
jgi:hypothetical protein